MYPDTTKVTLNNENGILAQNNFVATSQLWTKTFMGSFLSLEVSAFFPVPVPQGLADMAVPVISNLTTAISFYTEDVFAIFPYFLGRIRRTLQWLMGLKKHVYTAHFISHSHHTKENKKHREEQNSSGTT